MNKDKAETVINLLETFIVDTIEESQARHDNNVPESTWRVWVERQEESKNKLIEELTS